MTWEVYADGGIIRKNPSRLGGTTAYRILEGGVVVREGGSVYSPEDLGVAEVTNNLTELLAVVEALHAYREAAGGRALEGTVYSDSRVTLLRVFEAARLNGVPGWLAAELQGIQRGGLLAGARYVLLDGHPTRQQLEAGRGKRGNPVSAHNVWCDRRCGELAEAFLKGEVGSSGRWLEPRSTR